MTTLYLAIYEDPILAERAARYAWTRDQDIYNLFQLIFALTLQGKTDQIEPIILDARRAGISNAVTESIMMYVYLLRGEWASIEEAVETLGTEPGLPKETAMQVWLSGLLARGHLERAEEAVVALWRAARENQNRGGEFGASLIQAWLEMRRSGQALTFTPEQVRFAEGDLLRLRSLAPSFVKAGRAEQLERLIRHHAALEKDSKSRFVQEELQFARGYLELIRGNPQVATEMVEPLARNSNLRQRHVILGRIYEAREMWREAAAEYEEAMRNPHEKWFLFGNPAAWVLEQFRLARVYEKLGDTDRARHWYERFTEDWKDADPDIPELIEARERLGALGGSETAAR
jgi:tetratricopeptide (TPR) repeat protein